VNKLSFHPYFITFIVSMFPVAELRGGLPLGVSLGANPFKAYVISVLGNTAPVLPLLFGLKYLSSKVKKSKFGRVFGAIEKRLDAKKQIIQKYGILGIILLVAIPLPFTGAWTGSFVSFFLSIPVKYSFPAIFTGILLAGIIVLFATIGFFNLGKIFSGM